MNYGTVLGFRYGPSLHVWTPPREGSIWMKDGATRCRQGMTAKYVSHNSQSFVLQRAYQNESTDVNERSDRLKYGKVAYENWVENILSL